MIRRIFKLSIFAFLALTVPSSNEVLKSAKANPVLFEGAVLWRKKRRLN